MDYHCFSGARFDIYMQNDFEEHEKKSRSQQVLLNFKKKIGGNHAFFKDN